MSKRHIKIYRDEFDSDVWRDYCEICEVCESSDYIFIGFDLKNVKGFEE